MQTGKQAIAIFDIDTHIDQFTGNEIKEVKSARKLIARIDLVGINTAQLGQSQGFNFVYSAEIARYLYDGQKFVYYADQLYAVKDPSKARSPVNMLLNLHEVDDKEILEVIKQWFTAQQGQE